VWGQPYRNKIAGDISGRGKWLEACIAEVEGGVRIKGTGSREGRGREDEAAQKESGENRESLKSGKSRERRSLRTREREEGK